MDAAIRRWGSRVEFSLITTNVTCPGFNSLIPSARGIILQRGGKMLETRTRLHAAIPAERSANSKLVSFSRCFPTPLVKNIRFGTNIVGPHQLPAPSLPRVDRSHWAGSLFPCLNCCELLNVTKSREKCQRISVNGKPCDRLAWTGVSTAQTEVRQYLRVGLAHRKQVVAKVAVLGNHLVRVGSSVQSSVAAEAAGKIHVAKVVGIGSPSDVHFRENVLVININQAFYRPRNFRPVLRINLRILPVVVVIKPGGDFLRRLALAAVFGLQQSQPFLLDVWQRRRDLAAGHGLVHCVAGQMEDVRGLVVAVA